MDKKERNRIMGVVTFFIGFIIIIIELPFLFNFSSYSLLLGLFLGDNNCFFLALFVLAITLFLYAYFMIRPIKSLRGKKNLGIVAMIFGGVLVILPLIGIAIVFLPDSLESYIPFFFLHNILGGVIPYLGLLIPGIILFIHGWYMRKNLRIEKNS